jgi:iron complex outermembrane receptor protein
MHLRATLPPLLALTLAAAAVAQQAPSRPPTAAAAGAPDTVKLEAFVVTGSNIKRTEAETVLPITVIETADLDARGAATMSELFETLGMAEPSGITEINNGPQDSPAATSPPSTSAASVRAAPSRSSTAAAWRRIRSRWRRAACRRWR